MATDADTPASPVAVFAAPAVRGLRDEVMLAIERAIFLGDIAPGQRLIEADIARQMGISKAPVREAFRCLEQLGLVVTHPRRGTFVTRLSATLASEAFSLRALLEIHAIRLIAPTITSAQVQQLTALLSVEAAARADRYAIVDQDLAFHDRLFELGGHRLLQQAWTNLRQQVRLLLTVTGILRADASAGTPRLTLMDVHAPILDALQRRDRDRAEAALVAHLAEGERLLLEKLTDSPIRPAVQPDLFGRQPSQTPGVGTS